MTLREPVLLDNGFEQLFRKYQLPVLIIEQLIEMDGEPEQASSEGENVAKNIKEEPPAEEEKAPEEEAVAPNPPSTEVIKAAQEDILQLDVLVCGKCQNVYHFIEAFSEHKNSNECDMETQVFKSNTNEPTPQLWAFLLWKASRSKDIGNQSSPDWASHSWNLYQRWGKLPEDVRKTWIEAGKSLKTLTQLGRAKLDTQRVNATKVNKPIKTTMTPQQIQQQRQTLLELQKELEDDETQMMSTLGLIRGPKSLESKGKKANDKESVGIKENEGAKTSTNRIVRKSLKPKVDENDESEEEEYVVEKIVAKRVNPKTKKPEYLLKWEGFPSDQNTWESISNMGTCTKLVQEFERNLARQKARKALEASKLPKNVIKIEELVQNSTTTTQSTRPVRTSAKKALDHFKEWVNVGTKRKYESEEDSDIDDPKPKKQETQDLSNLFKKKILGNSNSKTPVLVANSKGVVRVDPDQVPNLSSGVYILSSQSGLIKVDDPTAQKLTEAMKSDGKKFTDTTNSKVMINETEIRKIPAKNVQPKIKLYKKDLQTGIIKKDSSLSPSVKIIQKSSMNKLPLPLRLTSPKINQQQILPKQLGSPKSMSTPKQIILGQKRARPLPGPIASPLRPPILKPKVTIRTAPSSIKKPQQVRMGAFLNKNNKERLSTDKFSDDDFDGGLPDEFPKDDEPIAPPSPTRPLTLCPLTGEVLGKAEGEKTPPTEDENILPEMEDDGMMRMEMSPGGTLRQIITKPQPGTVQQRKQQSVLQKKQQIKLRTTSATKECLDSTGAEQELISIEGEDGIIYQMTPEQQQMLINNGTFRVDSRVIQDENTADSENTEIVIRNGQIIQRTIQTNADEDSHDGSTILMQNDSSNDQIILQTTEGGVYVTQEGEAGGEAVLTLGSAVQEAVTAGTTAEEVTEEHEEATEDGQQMVAQIVQAEPPTPGGGPRKVVLLLPDGSLIHTEMDEEQYQALEFEK